MDNVKQNSKTTFGLWKTVQVTFFSIGFLLTLYVVWENFISKDLSEKATFFILFTSMYMMSMIQFDADREENAWWYLIAIAVTIIVAVVVAVCCGGTNQSSTIISALLTIIVFIWTAPEAMKKYLSF